MAVGKKVALIILDGFAISKEDRGNAIVAAKTPYLEEIFKKYPKALLKASSEEVGLPWGEFGNSEVGHTTIGLGRVVLQDLPQIDKAINNKSIEKKSVLIEAQKKANENNSQINIIGIASDGAVHGHINHMIALAKIFKASNPKNKIILHLITDGRDVPEKSADKYIEQIDNNLKNTALIGSLMGRYFAMDRDKNWDRIKSAYQAILGGAKVEISPKEVVARSYSNNKTDEFIEPVSFGDFKADLEKDIFIFCNYRADRAIQLTRAFVDPTIKEINNGKTTNNFITMKTYDDNLNSQVLFSNLELNDPTVNPLTNPLSKLVSEAGKTQFHIAETEKFAHVTYFFSGGIKDELPGQKNLLIQSEKVKSYDLFPQMKAPEITQELKKIATENIDFIVANYANPDMVGHSGNFDAAVKAVEVLDKCLSESIPSLLNNNYNIILTADHGNCDEMIDLKSGKPNKEHSLNPVPFLFISNENQGNFIDLYSVKSLEPVGILADIAPTIVDELGLELPSEMTGINLKNSLS